VPPWQEITITISRFSIGWDFYLWKESCTSRKPTDWAFQALQSLVERYGVQERFIGLIHLWQ
ncbi:hypothetical protein, partial [Nostoc sp.]|uniref:hypothetical protein n=1 Tax=Nostoc sp. TaxID=1180 RepID=UPI002FFA4299